ncbi:MAG: DUF4055 domain-containing protein [Stenomitos frigidus ULC029]
MSESPPQPTLKLLPPEKHPFDNPDLPSYQHPSYRAVLPALIMIQDLWQGQWSWMQNGAVTALDVAKKYLPQEEKETDASYKARLLRSPFDNYLKDAIVGFSGLLSTLLVGETVIDSVKENIQDVDLTGSNLATFWSYCTESALKHGCTSVLTEYPQDPLDEEGNPIIQDLEIEREIRLRPYFCHIERYDILNWKRHFEHGKMILDVVVIRETVSEPLGIFGLTEVTQYRVLEPGAFSVWRIYEDDLGLPMAVIHESGLMLDAKKAPLPVIPLTLFSVTEADPFSAMPPFLDLLALNIRHFQSTSDYYEILRLCNLPVPVRTGVVVPGQVDFSNVPDAVIGPRSMIDVPIGGDFAFAEPSGATVEATRNSIKDLEDAIERKTLAFVGNGEAARTATEVSLKSAQTQATLQNMGVLKESAIEEALKHWALYLGMTEGGGTIECVKDVLTGPFDAQKIQALSALVTATQLDLETFLELLRDGKVIKKDADIPKIVSLVKAAKAEAMQQTLDAMAASALATPTAKRNPETDEAEAA